MNLKGKLFVLLFLLGSFAPSTLKGGEIDKELSIYSKQTVNGPFLVNEGNLRRLNEVIKKRLSEGCRHDQITYTVFFNDNSNYVTKSFEVIVLEENSKNQKILGIDIKGRAEGLCEDGVPFSRFPKDSSISVNLAKTIWSSDSMGFEIIGSDRDWVSLTSSDLNERLESMVLKFTLGPDLTSLVIIFLVLFPLIIVLMWKAWIADEKLKKEKDASYLGNSFWRFLKREGLMLLVVGSPVWAFFLLIIWIIHLILSGYIERNFFPSTVFYFGKQIEEYRDLEALRENIFWGVGVAGIVSVLVAAMSGIYKLARKENR